MTTEKTHQLSIIVPVRNEEACLGKVLEALVALRDIIDVEIIVVDNNSTDRSMSIAREFDVITLFAPKATISTVRNTGVKECDGINLAFIDADVLVTEQWRQTIPTILSNLNSNPLQVLGARYHGETSTRFLDIYWYNRLLEYQATYINSGNLITSKMLFLAIEGFDDRLATAEDYDFCNRARANGATVKNITALKTHHLGYPKTITGFLNRERWHGKQDFQNLNSLLNSKIAWVATLNLFIFLTSFFITIFSENILWVVVYLAFLMCLGLALTLIRYGLRPLYKLPLTSIVFIVYIWGRSFAAIDRLVDLLKVRLEAK